MGTDDTGNGGGAVGGRASGQVALCLSSDAQFERERLEAEAQALRQKAYYAEWKARHERVSGSLGKEIYAEVKKRADCHGRKVWAQIWFESQAYVKSKIVPTARMEEQQRQLIAELRHIGNNINQLAKLGHIEARKHGGLGVRGNDRIGAEALRQFSRLEKVVARFDDQITITISSLDGE